MFSAAVAQLAARQIADKWAPRRRFLERHAFLGRIDMGQGGPNRRQQQAPHWRFIGVASDAGAEIRAANARNGVGRPPAWWREARKLLERGETIDNG